MKKINNVDDEVWKDIAGFEGLYLVSSRGRIFSTRSGRCLKLKVNVSHGYVEVELNVEGTPHYFRVHRLVALAFIPNPDNLPLVNHKDGVKAHNAVSNLEWISHSDNNKHAIALGLSSTVNMRKFYLLVGEGKATRVNSLAELSEITGYRSAALLKFRKLRRPIPDRACKGFFIFVRRG